MTAVWGYSVFLEVSHVFARGGKQVEITHLFVQLVSGNTKNAGGQRLVVFCAGQREEKRLAFGLSADFVQIQVVGTQFLFLDFGLFGK